MQTIDLICLGKLNAKSCAEGVAEYAKRLSAFANFKIIELPEEKIEEKNASPALVARALEKEGKAILSMYGGGRASWPCAWRANWCPARSWPPCWPARPPAARGTSPL